MVGGQRARYWEVPKLNIWHKKGTKEAAQRLYFCAI